MTISIVIPTRNPDHCTQLITQCRAYGYRDIVVVHPAGTPVPSDAQSVTTDGLVNAAEARNRGAAACHGEYLFFVDDDVQFLTDVPGRLAYCLQSPYISAVGAVITDAHTNGYWVRCLHRVMAAGQHMARVRHTPALLLSMALLVRRREFVACHGFATSYAGAAGEDADLSIRISQYGHLYVLPQAKISHHPTPPGWWSATRRMFGYGLVWPAVVRRNPSLASPLRQLARGWAFAILVASPVLALITCLRIRPRLPYLLGCWWLQWCWTIGVAHTHWHDHAQ